MFRIVEYLWRITQNSEIVDTSGEGKVDDKGGQETYFSLSIPLYKLNSNHVLILFANILVAYYFAIFKEFLHI
jgi:hypothetical protein